MFPFRRGVRRLTPEQAHQRAAGHDGVVLLDVREPHEWQAGHAPGAVHAPLSELVAGGELPVTARSRPLVVICRSGQRSQQAAKLLAKRGARATDVKGGMRAWADAGLRVVDVRGNSGSIA
ncbi:rhodanese-like domain-containing protein [Streptomyces decoyicus]|uniref:Rhodanese-like domain-containing protein n=1 Tax=Streptomyces decoyicus TaxID=249567 RepID=A0ABZ1FDC7_9ACTN|nr:rhodanese-like domain-containing protein [Streptomyces decoyicus]WSB68349.1 rhodanese-like domain-containing protein [Streptomyces decoyicus]